MTQEQNAQNRKLTREFSGVLEVDQEADAAYLRLRNLAVVQTMEMSTDVRVDLDYLGRTVGVEITSLNSHSALARVFEALIADSLHEEANKKLDPHLRDENIEAIMNKPTMNVDELGIVLSVGRRQAYEAVKRGEIPSIRIGKRILISTRVIERILAGEPPEAVGK